MARLLQIRRRGNPPIGQGSSAPTEADRFDAGRPLAEKAVYSACYAPTVSMYFDQLGDVRACCQNTGGLLGNIRTMSIREIWDGEGAGRLRAALAERDFGVGCGFCAWQVEEGGDSPFARGFDRHPVLAASPRWPVQMEFSMTNSCNLQCVMCNGDWSSSIRAHREQRPPLPVVYHDAFFDELAEFLPHLEQVNFLGGEPFLGREPLRVMEMMADMGLRTPVTVTTNGTQWSDRIERISDRLNISFVLSLDGITAATYESIRIGATFESVMANLDRMLDVAASKQNAVTLAHCLMKPNWHEFAELLAWAEQKGIASVGVNTVVYPEELSLYQMEGAELRVVVDELETQGRRSASSFGRFLPVWDEQLRALRNRVGILQSGQSGPVDPWPQTGPPTAEEPDDISRLPLADNAETELGNWSGRAVDLWVQCSPDWEVVDGEDVRRPIRAVSAGFAALVGRPPTDLAGRPAEIILELLRIQLGAECSVVTDGRPPNDIYAVYRHADGTGHEARLLAGEDQGDLMMLIATRPLDPDRPGTD